MIHSAECFCHFGMAVHMIGVALNFVGDCVVLFNSFFTKEPSFTIWSKTRALCCEPLQCAHGNLNFFNLFNRIFCFSCFLKRACTGQNKHPKEPPISTGLIVHDLSPCSNLVCFEQVIQVCRNLVQNYHVHAVSHYFTSFVAHKLPTPGYGELYAKALEC